MLAHELVDILSLMLLFLHGRVHWRPSTLWCPFEAAPFGVRLWSSVDSLLHNRLAASLRHNSLITILKLLPGPVSFALPHTSSHIVPRVSVSGTWSKRDHYPFGNSANSMGSLDSPFAIYPVLDDQHQIDTACYLDKHTAKLRSYWPTKQAHKLHLQSDVFPIQHRDSFRH